MIWINIVVVCNDLETKNKVVKIGDNYTPTPEGPSMAYEFGESSQKRVVVGLLNERSSNRWHFEAVPPRGTHICLDVPRCVHQFRNPPRRFWRKIFMDLHLYPRPRGVFLCAARDTRLTPRFSEEASWPCDIIFLSEAKYKLHNLMNFVKENVVFLCDEAL